MARDPELYKTIGRRVSRLRPHARCDALSAELVMVLRVRSEAGRLFSALEHMWGHVRDHATVAERLSASGAAAALMRAIQTAALRSAEPYLLASTALSDLAIHPTHQFTNSPIH